MFIPDPYDSPPAMLMNQGILPSAATVLLCLALASCSHVGQRLLHIQIEVDNQLEFTAIRGVRDDMPVDQMWDVLPDVRFEIAANSADSFEEIGDGTRTLNGDVVVRILHVNRELSRAVLSSLSVTRNLDGHSWSISKSECERIKKADAN
jgi:hypothetical protein